MPKIVKIPLIVLASLLALLLLLWGVMQTAAFQRYLSNRISSQLTDKLGSELSIGGIEIAYFDQLILDQVLLRDHDADTLIYIDHLQADYDLFSWNKENIRFDRLELDHPLVYLHVAVGDTVMNLQAIIERLKTGDSTTSSPVFSVTELLMNNGHFNYRNDNKADSEERKFNENNMHIRGITAALKDFVLIKDSLHFEAQSMSAREDCGLVIQDLKAQCDISSSGMLFDDLALQTERSRFNKYLIFKYDSYKDFSDFISKVRVVAELDQSQIHTADLAFFSNELLAYDDLIIASGKLSGTTDRMRGKDLNIQVGEQTSYQGTARITGIPDMANTFWDINAKSFITDGAELGRLIQLKTIPDELLAFGKMEYQGMFKGFLKEFVSIGQLHSALGSAQTDIKFALDEQGKEAYSGHIQSTSFDLGTLINEDLLGKASFSIGVVGSGIELSKMQNTITGDIGQLELNGYTYTNMKVNGDFSQYIFKGVANIQDPNLMMDFDGEIDLHPDNPNTIAKTQIWHANLKAIGLDKNESSLSLVGNVQLKGAKLDELNGMLTLDSLRWSNGEQEFPISDVVLSIDQQDGRHAIDLSSDLVDVNITGHFKFSEVSESFKDLIGMIYPESDVDPSTLQNTNYVTQVAIKHYHPLFDSYLSGLKFDQANMKMQYDSRNAQFQLTGDLCALDLSNVTTKELHFQLIKENADQAPSYTIDADTFTLSDSILFYTIHGKGEVASDRFNIVMNAQGDSNLSADVDAYVKAANDSISVFFNHVDAHINAKRWHMGKTDFANIVYHHDTTELFYFDFRNQQEIVFFDGAFGEGLTKVNMVFSNFLLSNANPFLVTNDIKLAGLANGYVDLSYRNGYPIFESDVVIDDLGFDQDTLGTFAFNSLTGRTPLEVNLNGIMRGGLLNGLSLEGNIDFNTPKEALDVNLLTTKGSIKPFEKYLDGLVSELVGYTTANLHVGGSLQKPQLSGVAKLAGLGFKVDYLQTRYTASALLEIGNNYMRIKDAQVVDRSKKTGTVSGQITHDNYTDFVFDILVSELDSFECLRTTRKDNELFYGTAFADGQMAVKGPLDDLLLQIDAKSRESTKIFIPLDDAETSGGQLSYVHFVNLKANQTKSLKRPQGTDGVRMDFNFEVTNDADVELIFDELLGDKITGNGRGNLRMEINTYGDFNMYGNIVIDKGDYLFTAFNVINKYFEVDPGSTLTWDGDPYNATLNLTAIKREYPRPSSLTGESIGNDDAIPVDCELKLTGLLFNPEVSFGLNMVNKNEISGDATSSFSTVLERVKKDQEELDRQVFALLALGRFITPSFIAPTAASGTGAANVGTNVTSSATNSLSDFVSSQLSNWLSSIDPSLQVSIDYQMATGQGQIDDELVLSLKRKFLNDRLELQGSYDAAATSNNPYDVNLQYKLNRDGSLRVKAFHRNANDPTLGNLSVTRSGVGFFYRHQFDHFWFEKDRKRKLKEADQTDSNKTSP